MSDKSSIEWTQATWNPTRGCSLVSAGCTNCYAMRQAHRFSGTGKAYEGLTRLSGNGPVWTGKVMLIEEALVIPLRWKRARRIFVNSMSDLFHESLSNEDIAAVFGTMAARPQHKFQVLTKRAERMHDWFKWAATEDAVGEGINACVTEMYGHVLVNEYLTRNDSVSEMEGEGEEDHLITDPPEWPLSNVWLGVSVENQKTADERIPWLLKTPAAVRWVSYEPALGPVDFEPWLGGDWACSCGWRGDCTVDHCSNCGFHGEALTKQLSGDRGDYAVCPDCKETESVDPGCPNCNLPVYACAGNEEELPALDWIVCGGESGPGARPFDVQWARDTVRQCKAAGVPVFVKQLGAWPVERDDAYGSSIGLGYLASVVPGITSKKGGDINEFPSDLRVREHPRCP